MAEAAEMAARLTDPIGHGLGMLGMIAGALLGAAVGALMIIALPVTAPLLVGALVGTAAVGALAGGALAGDQLMNGIQKAFSLPDPTTGIVGMIGSPNVLIGMLPAARAVLDMAAACDGLFSVNHLPLPVFGPPPPIAEGSQTVLINGMPAARVSSKLVCGAVITNGCPTVNIGGPTVRLLPVDDLEEEMRGFFGSLLQASLIAAGVITFLMGGEAFLGFATMFVGFSAVNEGMGMLGDAIGPGWRDILQGGTGLLAIAAGGKQSEEALSEPSTEDTPPTSKCAKAGEPVNAVTGEMITFVTDFELPGALPIRFHRAYASALGQQSWLGLNWACTFGQSVQPDGIVGFRYLPGDGAAIHFKRANLDDEGWIRSLKSSRMRLRQTASGFQVVNLENQLITFAQPRGNEWMVTEIRDLNGNSLSFHYERGVLHMVQHTGGYRLHITSTPAHITGIFLQQFDQTLVALVRYEYDSLGRLSGVDNGSGKYFRYEYDDRSRLVRWQDRNDHWYQYRYDTQGRVRESVGEDGLYHYFYAYDFAKRATVTVDSYGGTRTFHYDEKNQVTAQHDEVGGATYTTWDDRGNKLSVKDAEGRGVSYEYDADGNLVASTDSLGRATKMECNALGLPVLLVDGSGKRWTRTYDNRGNLLEAGREGKGPWRYERDSRGNLIRIVDPTGRSREFGYDSAGLPNSVTDWQGNRTRYLRDAFGRIVHEKDPLDAETHFAYNTFNKLVQVTLPNDGQIQWQYNLEGNLISRTAQDGSAYTYSYGPFDMRQSITRPSGATLRFHRDLQTHLTAVENERGEFWTYTYDLAGRVIEEHSFLGRKQSFAYDRSGLCVRKVNGRGEVTHIKRNKSGQIVQVNAPDGTETTFAYDRNGLVSEATNQWISVMFQRDEYGHILREIQGDRVIESTYDDRGLRTKRRTSEGEETRWSYDANGRVEQIALPHDEWLDFAYDAMGCNRERRFYNGRPGVRNSKPGGLVIRQEYDVLHRLTAQWAGLEAGASGETAALAERQYLYDLNGNPTEVYDRYWGTSNFHYDSDGRIIVAERERGLSEGFQYDASGNIVGVATDALRVGDQTIKGGAPELKRRQLGPGGRLDQTDNKLYVYDDEGRVILKKEWHLGQPERIWEFTWTAQGRVRSVLNPNGELWTYEYDAFGRRTKKIGPESSTTYVWDSDVVAEEIHATRAESRKSSWLFEPNSFRPLAKLQNGKVYACVLDQIGTPRELISRDGTLAWSAQLNTWGDAASEKAPHTDCPIRFQGQWFDEESQLHYNFHRYYDPSSGTYLSSDPIGLEGGPRLYGYVTNPFTWIDPTGLAGFGTGRPPHVANVTVTDPDGNVKSQDTLQSGNMTPEEDALGFPQNTLATHTEARATSQVPLDQGDSMLIEGQYAPCNSCKGKMNARAAETGANIDYTWPENGETKTWSANSKSRGCS
jgi:RHS repeat-associated protein